MVLIILLHLKLHEPASIILHTNVHTVACIKLVVACMWLLIVYNNYMKFFKFHSVPIAHMPITSTPVVGKSLIHTCNCKHFMSNKIMHNF